MAPANSSVKQVHSSGQRHLAAHDWARHLGVERETQRPQPFSLAITSCQHPLRHLFALVVPITVTIRDFLASGATDEVELDAMYQAWFKAVTLSATLWARPYSPDLW